MGNPTEPTPVAPQDEPLHCPLCDYNLHGLPEPRCPECGYAFDWDELRIAIREKKSWFFEHAERRLVRSFLRTAALTFLPGRLWKKVSAGHRSSPWRLGLFVMANACWVPAALLLSIPMIAAVAGVFVIRSAGYIPPASAAASSELDLWLEIVSNSIDRMTQHLLGTKWPLLIVILIAAPFISSIALNVFGTTLRRAGVKRVHAVRAIAYAWSPFLIVSGVLQIALWFRDSWRADLSYLMRETAPSLEVVQLLGPVEVVAAVLLLLLWSGWCVRQSLKHYLRIPQPTLTAILMQALVLLALVMIALFAYASLGTYFWHDYWY